MKANEAKIGIVYVLPDRFGKNKEAECYGPNYSNDFMLFYLCKEGKVRTVMLDEEVKEKINEKN